MKLRGPRGLVLELDVKDPATPAIASIGRYSSTYDCACGTGCVGSSDEMKLDEGQLHWLESKSEEAEAAINEARKDDPEYNQ